MSDDETEYEMEMPFVTVASVGGPHDDDSFVAGWLMAKLDILLNSLSGAASADGLLIFEGCQPQADLIAMKHGWVATFRESETDDWVYMDVAMASDEEIR